MMSRRPRAAGSSSTDDASTRLTPSEDGSGSEDGLTMMVEGEAFELRRIVSADRGNEEEEAEELRDMYEEGDGRARRVSRASVMSYELYTPDEERQVLRRLDKNLVGFVAVLYCLAFLDRSNIGNARIAGMEDDLRLGSKQYEWLLRAFYITYITFEWMTLLYKIVPPHVYISICVLSWGIVASLQAVATSFRFLLVLRALLGVGEAAFGPGIPFYLSFFFRRNELAYRTGLFVSASPLSSSFAGFLAWAITKVGEQSPLSPWRLLFLLEGFPSVLVAVWAWDFIPDGPGEAKWLTARQKKVAVLRLRQEREDAEEEKTRDRSGHSRMPRSGINVREILQTLVDPKCYLTAFMYFSCNVAFSSMPVFLPTILKDMGHSSLTAQALSAPPYLFAFVVVLITANLSDRYQSRSIFVMLNSLLASAGYTTIALAGYYQSPNTTIRYLALYPATAGFFSAVTIIVPWTINNQESDIKKGTGVAIVNLIGQCGPLVGTSIFPKEDGPWYVRGMVICAAFMMLVCVLAAILRAYLKMQNNRLGKEKTSGVGEYAGVPLEEGGDARVERKVFEYML